MPNSVVCLDDTTLEKVDRLDMDSHEMILSLISTHLNVCLELEPTDQTHSKSIAKPNILVETAFTYPDEDEPTSGCILVLECNAPS